jgi:hypothetical protein
MAAKLNEGLQDLDPERFPAEKFLLSTEMVRKKPVSRKAKAEAKAAEAEVQKRQPNVVGETPAAEPEVAPESTEEPAPAEDQPDQANEPADAQSAEPAEQGDGRKSPDGKKKRKAIMLR